MWMPMSSMFCIASPSSAFVLDQLDQCGDFGRAQDTLKRRHHRLITGDDLRARIHHRAREITFIRDDVFSVGELHRCAVETAKRRPDVLLSVERMTREASALCGDR